LPLADFVFADLRGAGAARFVAPPVARSRADDFVPDALPPANFRLLEAPLRLRREDFDRDVLLAT
jgi:hypothetical protein